MANEETKNKDAVKGSVTNPFFKLADLAPIQAGTGYSTSVGPIVEGERMQVGLIDKARGTGSRPHSHPNEQFNYVLRGTLKVQIGDGPWTLCPAGTLIYVPPNVVHSMIATPEEDVVFYVVKDLTHGIIGKAADGTMAGPHYEPGFEPTA